MRGTRGIGLYVHIPFCAARCPYCDFATAPATSALRGRYLAALVKEIAREGAALGRRRVRTLFFGGGTPSLLEPDEIALLGCVLRSAFALRPREVTIEANPATLERQFEELSLRHTAKYGFRTYDLLHVASALIFDCDTFWSFDTKASRLAKLEGLEIRN